MPRIINSLKDPSRFRFAGRPWLAAIFLLGLIATASGCSSSLDQPSEKIPRPENRVIVIGLDGYEWNVALPMVQSGELPAIRSLMERGTFGELATLKPTSSPVIWTSIATGKVPQKHGILDLIVMDAEGERERPYYSTDRTTKAIWNIHSDFDSKVNSIGWWKTYPVEPINGFMVSQLSSLFSFYETRRGVFRGVTSPGEARQVHPVERHESVMRLAAFLHSAMPKMEPQIFGEFPKSHSPAGLRFWENIRWVLSLDAIHFRIAKEELLGKEPFNLMLVYLRGADVISHNFWRFSYPKGYKTQPTPDEFENYARMIPVYYKHLDKMVGDLVQTAGPLTTFFIISDHGMEQTNLEEDWKFKAPARKMVSGGHEEAPPAFFLAAGPNIASHSTEPIDSLTRADIQAVGTVMDVTPTLLALAGLPVGRDMDGSVLTSVFAKQFLDRYPPRYIPTHDEPGWRNRVDAPERNLEEERDRIEELRSLGYID